MIQEDSTSETLIEKLKKTLKNYKSFYIHLASNHTHEHVLKELNLYSQFLKKDNYIIADDTIVNQIPNQSYRPRPWNKDANPMTAVNEFLKNNKNFKIDHELNYNHLISSSPGGYIFRSK